jgi:hypothetical protein
MSVTGSKFNVHGLRKRWTPPLVRLIPDSAQQFSIAKVAKTIGPWIADEAAGFALA